MRFFISTCMYAPPLPGWVCWIFTARQMPPSYSMMLPGRMSTPLIFMSSLGETGGKEPRQHLAAGLLPGKQLVGIDRGAVPPALARRHLVDREVEVRTGGIGVAAMADAPNDLTALDLLSLRQA